MGAVHCRGKYRKRDEISVVCAGIYDLCDTCPYHCDLSERLLGYVCPPGSIRRKSDAAGRVDACSLALVGWFAFGGKKAQK